MPGNCRALRRLPGLAQGKPGCLPILTHFPTDHAPYITAGVAVIHDPDYGRNVSFHRLMVLGPRTLAARIVEGRGTDTAWRKAPEACRLPFASATRWPFCWPLPCRLPKAWTSLASPMRCSRRRSSSARRLTCKCRPKANSFWRAASRGARQRTASGRLPPRLPGT
jgi:hypothetical protein